jgi:hypothetical protein
MNQDSNSDPEHNQRLLFPQGSNALTYGLNIAQRTRKWSVGESHIPKRKEVITFKATRLNAPEHYTDMKPQP